MEDTALSVKVLHFISSDWGFSHLGYIPCNVSCWWYHSAHMNLLSEVFQNNRTSSDVSLSLYNMHYLWAKKRDAKPQVCELNTTLTMSESEESNTRFKQLFEQSSGAYDGSSTTSPTSSVQRVYEEAHMNTADFFPLKNFTSLIKGASYIASDCHRWDTANSRRDNVVHDIRRNGLRVDGLARCLRSHAKNIPENIQLKSSSNPREQLRLKRETVGHYLFDMAFENSIEDGYVTEKPFDAIYAGVVPVYLGDAAHLKSLLPHPKAAIFVADFPDTSSLAKYLLHLSENETAYEIHRQWRRESGADGKMKIMKSSPLLATSWPCRVCQWAALTALTNSSGHYHLSKDGRCRGS